MPHTHAENLIQNIQKRCQAMIIIYRIGFLLSYKRLNENISNIIIFKIIKNVYFYIVRNNKKIPIEFKRKSPKKL